LLTFLVIVLLPRRGKRHCRNPNSAEIAVIIFKLAL